VRFSIEFTGDARRMMDNIILHIPHASLCLPPDFWRDITVDKEIAIGMCFALLIIMCSPTRFDLYHLISAI
jgi:hypothetical protein